MALGPRTRLGAYEILSLLGSGGMGEVWRAHDTKLARDVAIKVLPQSLSDDPERLARFEREAKTLAALNHPNIAHIHGFEDSSGVPALVMELVEGPTLSDRIAKGPIPLDDALPIAKQIAEGLEAAHEQGIIHRDLKPANIKVRDDGTVKILDFGLAKALEPKQPSAINVTQSPTITTPAMITGVGMILGTAAYMSPEQAKGQTADKRSDIWAFGCVLYEMLTGHRAFAGEDVSETLASVLKGTPDWAALPPDIPVEVREVLNFTIEKNRKARLQDVSTAQFLLDHRAIAPVSLETRGRPRPRIYRTGLVLLGLIVAAGLGAIVDRALLPSHKPVAVVRFSIELAQDDEFTGTAFPVVAVSRDGGRLAWIAGNRLYVRNTADPATRVIAGTETAGTTQPYEPVFSPDGDAVAFLVGSFPQHAAIKTVAFTGGVTPTIADVSYPMGMTWATDIVFAERDKGISRVSPSGGKPESLIVLKPGEVAQRPSMLPESDVVLFTLASNVNISTNGLTIGDWQNASIVAQSLRSGKRKAVPVVEGVQRHSGPPSTGSAHADVSDTGTLLYVWGPAALNGTAQELTVIKRDGGFDRVRLPPAPFVSPHLSPDAKRITYGIEGEDANIWIYELSGETAPRQLTFGGQNRYPLWSTDGTRVAFQSNREKDDAIFWQRADGTSSPERLTTPQPGTAHVPESFSPDGKWLLIAEVGKTFNTLFTLSLVDRKLARFSDVQSLAAPAAAFSPDGHWVAYGRRSQLSDNIALFAEPFPPTGSKYLITPNGFRPLWSPDGKEVFFGRRGQSWVVSVTTAPTFAFGNPRQLPILRFPPPTFGEREYDVFPDGQRFIFATPADSSRTIGATRQIQVVVNWFTELQQRVPTR